MKLFNRQKNDQGTTEQPTVEELLGKEAVEGQAKRVDWRRTIPRLLATLIVVAIIAAGILWAFGGFDGNKDSDKKNPGQTAQNDTQSSGNKDDNSQSENSGNSGQSGNTNAPSAPPSGSNSTSNTGGNNNSSASPAPSSNALSSSTDQLAASGPAETIAVFMVATAAGAVLYQLNLRRQD